MSINEHLMSLTETRDSTEMLLIRMERFLQTLVSNQSARSVSRLSGVDKEERCRWICPLAHLLNVPGPAQRSLLPQDDFIIFSSLSYPYLILRDVTLKYSVYNHSPPHAVGVLLEAEQKNSEVFPLRGWRTLADMVEAPG